MNGCGVAGRIAIKVPMQAELSQTFRESGAIMFNFLFGPKNPTKDWQRDSSGAASWWSRLFELLHEAV